MPKLKRNVSVRTTAQAGELLDQYLADHPGVTEAQVTAEALALLIKSAITQEGKEKADERGHVVVR